MKKHAWLWLAVCIGICICGTGFVRAAEDKPPDDLPDLTESSKLPDKMPKEVSGAVTIAGKPAPGIRITDGVDFAVTDKDGKYTIAIKPDPLIPYTPSRTIGVCWPSGTWPAQGGWLDARWQWWRRLKDIEDPRNVNFALMPREGTLPVCVVHGTDPHDFFRRAQNYVFRDEIAAAGNHAAFCVLTGDLGYFGFAAAQNEFPIIEQFTTHFPVPVLNCPGNHDVVGIHSQWWKVPHELAGYGGFIKYLGPIRWSFDYAGIHFVGMDYSLIDDKGHLQCGIADTAIDWLEKDLMSLPKGTPVYFFNHQCWSPNKRFYDVCARYGVKLCLAGDSHRNLFLGKTDGVEYWTKMSLYTLVYIDKTGFQLVDRCIYHGARNGWDGAWNHCNIFAAPPDALKAQRGEHIELKDVTINSDSKKIDTVKGDTYDLRIGARPVGDKPADRWGLRITGNDGGVHEFVYDDRQHMVTLMGLKTFFNPVIPFADQMRKPGTIDPEEEWVEMRIYVMPDRVRVIVNNRLHYQKFIKPGAARKIEFFSEGGKAEFGRVDVWQRTWPKDWKGNNDPTAPSG